MESRTRPLQSPPTVVRANTRRREVAHAGLTWIDVTQPTSAEVAYLRERFRLDSLALEDVLSTLQRPKLDVFPQEEYLFVILQVPTLDRDSQIVASEVAVFAGRDFFVTLHDGDLKPLRRIFAAASSDESARSQLMSRGSGYLLYRIADTLLKQCFPILYRVDDDLGRLERRVDGPGSEGLARDLAGTQRDIITLRHVLQPNQPVLHSLADHSLPFLQIDSIRYFGDAADAIDKLVDLLTEQHEVAHGLSSTLDSLALQRLGMLVQLGAVLIAIALPFLLVGSIASMYGGVSFAERPLLFAGGLLIAVALAAGMLGLARYRAWI